MGGLDTCPGRKCDLLSKSGVQVYVPRCFVFAATTSGSAQHVRDYSTTELL